MNRFLMLCCLFAAVAGVSCASNPPPSPRVAPALYPAPAAAGLRLIIKFNDPTLDPSAPAFLARLSADMGETFTYVRPMSGDAHVFLVGRPLTAAQREDLLRRLSARQDVAYAEEDALMQIQ